VEELVRVLVNQKKGKEVDGEIIIMDLDPTQKVEMLLLMLQNHQESVED
jgi:hypothetical protein